MSPICGESLFGIQHNHSLRRRTQRISHVEEVRRAPRLATPPFCCRVVAVVPARPRPGRGARHRHHRDHDDGAHFRRALCTAAAAPPAIVPGAQSSLPVLPIGSRIMARHCSAHHGAVCARRAQACGNGTACKWNAWLDVMRVLLAVHVVHAVPATLIDCAREVRRMTEWCAPRRCSP